MPKRLNPNLVKIHRNYTVEEAAVLLDRHKNTVRSWVKEGLPVCDEKRPTLILGVELRKYLQGKRTVNKKKCRSFELYCMRCREPKRPAGNMVDYCSETGTSGRLIGLCPDCDGMMNRYASVASLDKLKQELDVSIPKSQEHINKWGELPVNSDFK
ncbi:MAG: helix-turn-helix domain-containing protein [Pseudohongiellaceae bacterium]